MNKLRSASVVVSDPDFQLRFAARGGLGAVMGSKGLLAVVIESPEGKQRVSVDKSKFIQTSRKLNRLLIENPKTGKTFREFGTTAIVKVDVYKRQIWAPAGWWLLALMSAMKGY